jgi:hypothetical protein
MLTLITDGCVEVGVKCGFILREVVEINKCAVNVTELDITNAAINKASENQMKDFGSLRDWTTIIKREVKVDLVAIQLHSMLVVVDVHSYRVGAAAVFVMVGFFNVDFVLGLV